MFGFIYSTGIFARGNHYNPVVSFIFNIKIYWNQSKERDICYACLVGNVYALHTNLIMKNLFVQSTLLRSSL